jgi:hypothetical protein
MARRSLIVGALLASLGCASSPPSSSNNNTSTLLQPGRACNENEECQSGWCVDLPAGRACAALCAGECGSGLTCKRANGRDPSSASICVPLSSSLCIQCPNGTDVECGTYGDLCLPRDNSHYCALDCSETQVCPEGYRCDSIRGDDGREVSRQCVPESGSCTCSSASAGTTRACRKSVPGVGLCVGQEVCDANAGWVSCDARTPMPELCDQQDNDCDNLVDENLDGGPLQRACGYGPEPRRAECVGAETCVNGVYSSCIGANPLDVEATCDGLDDDCNGQVDEGLLHTADHCSSCGDECPPGPALDTSTSRTCAAEGNSYYCAAIKCRMPYFDVNGSEADGCEVQDDHVRIGDTVTVNSSWQSAFVIGAGDVSCWDGSYQKSCALKIPSDGRQHVPTSPPTPNTDFHRYRYTGGACFADQRICVKVMKFLATDSAARVEVCVSGSVGNLSTAPTFDAGACSVLDLSAYGSGAILEAPLDPGSGDYTYVRVRSPVSGGGPFAGTYAVAAFDGADSCPISDAVDTCLY